MDRQEGSRSERPSPDYDLGSSSFPPIPDSADVPEVVLQRHDELDPYERGKLAGRRLGAYQALATARRTLREAGALELARILDRLVAVEDLDEALRRLEDTADRAGRP